MSSPHRWTRSKVRNGFRTATLSSWEVFDGFLRKGMPDTRGYVWRGQRDANWKLTSTFDRLTEKSLVGLDPALEGDYRGYLADNHLESFKLSVRGRRGSHPSRIEDEDEWWAIGQHQGLATPLLDWTESPFVALYFAFLEAAESHGTMRSVWALSSYKAASPFGPVLSAAFESKPKIKFVRPKLDENSRLVAQAGLFTRAPRGTTVEEWVQNTFEPTSEVVLVQIKLPDVDRSECLKALDLMNINQLTLFPDLYGASQHCNAALESEML